MHEQTQNPPADNANLPVPARAKSKTSDPAVQAAVARLREEGSAARKSILETRVKNPEAAFGNGVFRVRTEQEIAAAEARAEEQRRLAKIADARQGRRLPRGYAKASLSAISSLPMDSIDAYSGAVDAMNRIFGRHMDKPMIVALIGEIGAGKTYLACALINAMTAIGRLAMYTTAFDYILAVRKTFNGGESDQSDVENAHIKPELLVLDEMQVRGETTHEELLLLRLIDKRYQYNRATLLLSNHATKEEFRERIDARIWDRMKDGGGVRVVDWPSLRGRINPSH